MSLDMLPDAAIEYLIETSRCDWSDLLVRECAHCRGIDSVEEIERVRLDEEALLGRST